MKMYVYAGVKLYDCVCVLWRARTILWAGSDGGGGGSDGGECAQLPCSRLARTQLRVHFRWQAPIEFEIRMEIYSPQPPAMCVQGQFTLLWYIQK